MGKADEAGNVIAEDDFKFSKDDRSFYAMNLEVTADNYKDFTDPANTLYETAQAQLDEKDSPKKKVWLSIYNSADNFLAPPTSRCSRSMLRCSTSISKLSRRRPERVLHYQQAWQPG